LTLKEIQMITHQPERGDAVEAWIKRHRDCEVNTAGVRLDTWFHFDAMLDEYREHADTGTPLDREVQGPHEDGR
jgi:hypothetical protein